MGYGLSLLLICNIDSLVFTCSINDANLPYEKRFKAVETLGLETLGLETLGLETLGFSISLGVLLLILLILVVLKTVVVNSVWFSFFQCVYSLA